MYSSTQAHKAARDDLQPLAEFDPTKKAKICWHFFRANGRYNFISTANKKLVNYLHEKNPAVFSD